VKEKRDVLNAEPLFAADHLGAKEVAESLRRQELLTGEERREVERRRPVDVGRELKDTKGRSAFLPLLGNVQRQFAGREGNTIQLA
jgi:hypothetical protein